jgi:outer membrane protein
MKKIFPLFILWCNSAFSQDHLSLQQCIDLMLQNSLQTASETSSLRNAQIERSFHFWTLLPSLSGSVGANTNFGRRVDPFTNTFATNTVNSQSYGLSSNMTLFNGFSYHYGRLRKYMTVQVQETDVALKKNTLLIRLIDLYITVCKLNIQLEQATIRIEKYKQIQKIQQLLISGGRISAIDTLKSHNSLLNEELVMIKLSTEKRMKKIELNYLIGKPINSEIVVEMASISECTTRPQFNELTELEKAQIQQQMTDYQYLSDRSMILPSLSLSGNLGTGFSTNNKDYLAVGNPTKPYSDQIQQNLYQGIGLYLTIPLFNRGSWLKTKQLNEVKKDELNQQIELKKQDLELRKLQSEQDILLKKAVIIQTEQIVSNLQLIYDKSVLLYKDGRITYNEIENTFLDWQMRIVELETLKLEFEQLKMYK